MKDLSWVCLAHHRYAVLNLGKYYIAHTCAKLKWNASCLVYIVFVGGSLPSTS